jgi:Xylose isomerase-like TIM barrel
MPVRLGISPIGWSNDDLPELGGDTALETCLAEARLAGFQGIELGNKFPRDPAVLRPILERHGLSLISGWYSGRLLDRSVTEELAVIEVHRALLVAMGCAVLVYAETSRSIAGDRCRPLSGRPRLGDGGWRDFGGRLTDLAQRLSRRGIRLVYHHHIGSVVESEAEIDRLMAATGDSVALLLDTGTWPLPASIRPSSPGVTDTASRTSTARMCGATSSLASVPAMRAFSPPFSTASLPCRATAASILARCLRPWPRRTIAAGWSSRPSRIRQRRRRSLMPGSASRI